MGVGEGEGGSLHVKDNVDASGSDKECCNVDAVARHCGIPKFFDRFTFEDDGEAGRNEGA